MHIKITVQRVSSRIARVSSRLPRNRHDPELAELQHQKSNQKFPKIYKVIIQNVLNYLPKFSHSTTGFDLLDLFRWTLLF